MHDVVASREKPGKAGLIEKLFERFGKHLAAKTMNSDRNDAG
jgi:hypothetical protein